jgi:hypothetical protein
VTQELLSSSPRLIKLTVLLGDWSRDWSRALQFLNLIVKKSNLSLDAKQLLTQHLPVLLIGE